MSGLTDDVKRLREWAATLQRKGPDADAAALTRAADALAREPALMRVVEAAKALDFYGPGEGRESALSAALRALDEVGR